MILPRPRRGGEGWGEGALVVTTYARRGGSGPPLFPGASEHRCKRLHTLLACWQYSTKLRAEFMYIQLPTAVDPIAIPAALRLPPLSKAQPRADRVHFLVH